MAHIGKKTKKNNALIDRTKLYSIEDAIGVLLTAAKERKFVETIEIAMNLGVDPRQNDQVVRGVTELPHGTGAVVRVAVFAKDAKADEAKAAGADIVGADDLAEEVMKGNINFDRCIATPDMMPLIAKIGKILGPRGLMPNPKLGTVTMDVKKAVESSKGGAVEFRAAKDGIVHARIGKATFEAPKLADNARAFIGAISRAKPAGARGSYIKKITLSSTMGPGVKIDLQSIAS
jgi:large subunit ribosomal protein L1